VRWGADTDVTGRPAKHTRQIRNQNELESAQTILPDAALTAAGSAMARDGLKLNKGN
jgi:hypothetical protein